MQDSEKNNDQAFHIFFASKGDIFEIFMQPFSPSLNEITASDGLAASFSFSSHAFTSFPFHQTLLLHG